MMTELIFQAATHSLEELKCQEELDAYLEAQAREHRAYWEQRCLTAYKKWCDREGYVIWDDVVAEYKADQHVIIIRLHGTGKRGYRRLALYYVGNGSTSRVKAYLDDMDHVKVEDLVIAKPSVKE